MKLEFKKGKENYRLLKMIHSLDRNLISIDILGAILKGGEPFIPIIGSAYIIDSLLEKNWRQAIIYVFIMILITGIIGVIASYIEKIKDVKSMTINRLCNISILLKAISLDYATFEDKKNLEEFQAADYNVGRNGGFGQYMLYFSDLLTGIIGFLVAIILLIKLCLLEVKGEGILNLITSRIGSIILMAIMIVTLAIVYFKLSKNINKKNLNMYKEMMDVNQKMEFMTYRLPIDKEYAKEIRLYNMQGMIYREWKKLSIEIIGFYQGFWKATRRFLMTTSFLSDFVLLSAYMFVGLKTFVGAVTIGAFTQYVGAVRQMNTSLRTIVEAINKINLCQSYLSFYTDFLDKKNKLDTGSLPVERRRDNEYEIEFHNVSFKYPGSEEYILKNVSVKLDMKNKFAIVGRNGAGKTTFIKLLCRFYDVTEGSITLNGVDIRKYDYQEYLNIFASVFQDFSLFSIPVKENVASSEKVDEERIWKVLECAGVKDRVEKMGSKLDTRLYHEMGEGEDISGGEAQKIAIARALYKNAPFVILDEPTAALDPISEYEIYSRFNEMVNDKTSIYISHRMSSCRFCDDILVFDQGMILQRGNHESLMKDINNVYAKLWHAQAKYYAEA
ncbi:MAG: ABC transporter ATP-binding protein [Clostridium sp.]|nr:ABC transporter ATP-binding protein [Clostridium sp.]MDU7085429.1 ABC transporter ATP-binding protein [Clostridium sp.]